MARKNLIGISDPLSELDAPRTIPDRPIAGFVPAQRATALVGGITKTLGAITEKMERAQTLEKQLTEGHTVVELDPDLIDCSFVMDRLSVNPIEQAQLVQQIRENGQLVPILVRPHPERVGRYQVAYGHRRLAAIREIGGKIRAVVRGLNDQQLVISQGQENSARTDLSYIERALFAVRLEDRKFPREVIMSALGVDKAALSKMIGVASHLPVELIEAIGPAPSIGRRRWMDLAELLVSADRRQTALTSAGTAAFLSLDTDQRFEAVCSALRTAKPSQRIERWEAPDHKRPVQIKQSAAGTTFVFNSSEAPGFDQYVRQKLESLYLAYKQEIGD